MLLSKEKKERIIILLTIFVIIYFSLIYRLYNIQVIQTNKFKEIAQQEHLTSFSIEGERGNIYDRNYKKLAVNINDQSLFAIPPKVGNPQETTLKISSILNLKTKDVLEKLNQKKSFVWIKRKLKEIGIKDYYNFSTHNIRKTHGMYLKAIGIEIGELCQRLGHDYNTYIKHYGSPDIFSEKDMRMIREILGDLYIRQRRY